MRLTLAVAIVVAAVAGCGGDGDDEMTSRSSTKAGTAAKPRHAPKPSPAAQRKLDRRLKELENLNRRLRAPQTPAERVQGTVKLVLTTNIPASCEPPFVTRRYVAAAYGGRQGCVDAPGSVADKVDIKNLQIDASRATVAVVPSGGPYDGERVTVSLVSDGRRWAVDGLDADVPVGP